MLKAAMSHTHTQVQLRVNDPLRPTRPPAIPSHSSPASSVGGNKPRGTLAHTRHPPTRVHVPDNAPTSTPSVMLHVPMGRDTTLHLLGIRCVRGQSVESDELSAELCEEEFDEADEVLEDDVDEPEKAKRNKVANTVPIAGTTMEFPHPWKMRPRD